MNKDEVAGKTKDAAGRVERQVGEWTGNKEAQVEGAAKQVEGKVQNAWGAVKDAGEKVLNRAENQADGTAETEEERARRKAS